MSEFLLFYANDEDSGKRLDVFLSENIEQTSRAYIKNLIDDQKVTINGNIAKKSGISIKSGDQVEIEFVPPVEIDLSPENIPLDIIYEDQSLAVINKQQGLVVHPGEGTPCHTLVNALLYHIKDLSGINGVIRPGIVHRLDKDTSGLLVIAKNDVAHRNLAKQIETKTAIRCYYALVDGIINEDSGIIDRPLARSKKDRRLIVIDKDGKRAVTLYNVVTRFPPRYTLVEYELKTGRTHQIRVHSKSIGHTVVGDLTYGGSNKFNLNGQLLHAYKLSFNHPVTNQPMQFTCPLPAYFQAVLDSLNH